MDNDLCPERGERGQALVVMVFAIIALLVVIGLALDGGTVFLERRRMQNSSDAAALAGTRLLAKAICGDGASDAAIAQRSTAMPRKTACQTPTVNQAMASMATLWPTMWTLTERSWAEWAVAAYRAGPPASP